MGQKWMGRRRHGPPIGSKAAVGEAERSPADGVDPVASCLPQHVGDWIGGTEAGIEAPNGPVGGALPGMGRAEASDAGTLMNSVDEAARTCAC